jgi:hypothetical protein
MIGMLFVALAGFGAQLVDGSLGMGYGLTSSTLLIAIGLVPAVASASVHLAEIGTSAASAYSHARMGNVDKTVPSAPSSARPSCPASPPRQRARGPVDCSSSSASTSCSATFGIVRSP